MAANVVLVRDQKVYFAEHELTGRLREIDLQYSAEAKDATALNDATQSNVSGVVNTALSADAFWEAGANKIDPVLFQAIGVNDKIVSIGAEAGADGERGFSFLSLVGSYVPKFDQGEPIGCALTAQTRSVLVRNTIMMTGAKTTTTNGTARQLGAVAAAQKVWAFLHVTAGSGTSPTLDVTVESDDASGFATPTTQLTFTQATAATSEHQNKAGAITDDWWRVVATIGGTSPSFDFVCLVGIR